MYEYAYVYILTNKHNRPLYTGVTSNLEQRIWQHRTGAFSGFTRKYGCKKLLWFEETPDILSAIEREKQIKSWSRRKKIALLEAENPDWNDISLDLQ